MVKEAELHKEEDEKRKEEIELRNQAEGLIIQIEQTLTDNADKIDENQKTEIEKLKNELQTALDNNDYDTLKTKIEALQQAAQARKPCIARCLNNKTYISDANTNTNSYDDNVWMLTLPVFY